MWQHTSLERRTTGIRSCYELIFLSFWMQKLIYCSRIDYTIKLRCTYSCKDYVASGSLLIMATLQCARCIEKKNTWRNELADHNPLLYWILEDINFNPVSPAVTTYIYQRKSIRISQIIKIQLEQTSFYNFNDYYVIGYFDNIVEVDWSNVVADDLSLQFMSINTSLQIFFFFFVQYIPIVFFKYLLNVPFHTSMDLLCLI